MRVFCLLNHTLTENQIKELEEKYSCTEIIYPSEELSNMWLQIPAVEKIDIKTISAIKIWLKQTEKNDVLIVQGEFGSTFMIVDYALKHELKPLHAVTKRIACEQRNGELVAKQYIFEHVCFREYAYSN